MRRRNKILPLIFFLLTALFLAGSPAQGGAPSQSPAAPAANSQAAPAGTAPVHDSSGKVAAPNASQDPDSSESGVFVFRKQVEEVVLHATVIDDKQHIVTTLDRGDFNVF